MIVATNIFELITIDVTNIYVNLDVVWIELFTVKIKLIVDSFFCKFNGYFMTNNHHNCRRFVIIAIQFIKQEPIESGQIKNLFVVFSIFKTTFNVMVY